MHATTNPCVEISLDELDGMKVHFFTHSKLKIPCARVTGNIRRFHGHYVLHDGTWYAYYYKKTQSTDWELRKWLDIKYELHVARSILE